MNMKTYKITSYSGEVAFIHCYTVTEAQDYAFSKFGGNVYSIEEI